MFLQKCLKQISLSLVLLGTSLANSGSLSFDIQLSPVGNFTAKAESLSGSVAKKGDEYTAKKIVLKIADLNSGLELRDQHMKDDYFEVASHPTAELLAAKGKNGKFKAKMKIHGVTKVVGGTYEVSGSDLTAKFKTSLSAWKIKKAAYMGVGVLDEVEVVVKLPVN